MALRSSTLAASGKDQRIIRVPGEETLVACGRGAHSHRDRIGKVLRFKVEGGGNRRCGWRERNRGKNNRLAWKRQFEEEGRPDRRLWIACRQEASRCGITTDINRLVSARRNRVSDVRSRPADIGGVGDRLDRHSGQGRRGIRVCLYECRHEPVVVAGKCLLNRSPGGWVIPGIGLPSHPD